MRYLFFDIECANMLRGKAKICSFGYVLTDTSFNIIDKKDILINPASFFDTYALKRMNTTLPYPREEYERAGKFPVHYERLKELLTEKDQIVVGHGTVNDAHFILHECERYKLEPFDFLYSDTVKMYAKLERREKKLDLNSIYEEFFPGENGLHSHKSDDDAEMTMRIAKNICDKTGLNLEDIIQNNNLLSEEVFSGRIIDPESYLFRVNPSGCRKPDEIIKRYLELQTPSESGSFKGKKVALKARYQWLNLATYMHMIKLVNQGGGKFIDDKRNADILVQAGEKLSFEKPCEQASIINFADFFEMSGSWEDRELSLVEMREIIGNFPENRQWYAKYLANYRQEYTSSDLQTEKVFKCNLDLPVLKYTLFGEELDAEGKITFLRRRLLYNSSTDMFTERQMFNLRVARDSIISEEKFRLLKEDIKDRLDEQKKLLFPNQIDPNMKEYCYHNIYVYKFLAEFNKDRIEFYFRDTDLYEKKMHKIASSDRQIEEEIKELICRFYNIKEFSRALSKMSKMKFGYRYKDIPKFDPVKQEYEEGMRLELAKNYRGYYQSKNIDKSNFPLLVDAVLGKKYIPALMSFKNDIYKEKLEIPVVIVEDCNLI